MPIDPARLPEPPNTVDSGQHSVGAVVNPAAGNGINMGADTQSASLAGQQAPQVAHRINAGLQTGLFHQRADIFPASVIFRGVWQASGPYPLLEADLPQFMEPLL